MSEDLESMIPSKEAYDAERELISTLTEGVASSLHDAWRETRKVEGSDTYEPRLKGTKDQEWIKKHGTDQVDIANTTFEDLPTDWQAENRAAAEGVVNSVTKAINVRRPLTPQDISEWMRTFGGDSRYLTLFGVDVHEQWLARNGSWAPPEQKLPFFELSRAEQEKDEAIVKQAVVVSRDLTKGGK